jgi:N-acetylneuraminic acid mutarotase
MKAYVLLAIALTACASAAAQVPCKNHYILAEPCRVDVLRTWRWESAGAMSTPRRSHAATLLEDGRVLVVGGIGESDSATIPNYLASAEIYDPATNRWSPVPDMTIRRALPVTIRLRDGRVLATGDIGTWQEDFVITGIAEAYDPATGRWSGAGRMITPRVGHTMTLLDDGTVLVAGGLDQYDMPVGAEIYDPVANRWEIAPPMRTLRFGHTATRLPDGSVLVAGGSDDDFYGAAIAGAERYDPVQREWLDASQLSAARYHHTATLLPDGEVLVVGGYNHVPSRDPRSFTTYYIPTSFAVAERFGRSGWSVEAPLNFARTQHAAAPLPGGMVLVSGGGRWTGAAMSYFPISSGTAEVYDPVTASWLMVPDSSANRSQHTATTLPDGRVLIVGGEDLGTPPYNFALLGSAEIYGPPKIPTSMGFARQRR